MTRPPITKKELEAALPDTTRPLSLKGIEGSVAVYRDSYGIPHVRAGSAHDAFFGQGFVTAQDRLFHMDHERRFVYGRWAELAGEAALEQDVAIRRFQVHESVRVDYEALNPETRAMMDAYAAGVNAFIDTTESLPFEYSLVDAVPERWEPETVLPPSRGGTYSSGSTKPSCGGRGWSASWDRRTPPGSSPDTGTAKC